MCKNMFLVGITNQKNAYKFMKSITPLMSLRNTDGFGYVGISPTGMFSERFLKNDDAFNTVPFDSTDIQLAESLGGLVDHESIKRQNDNFIKNKTQLGKTDFKNMTSILLHTRKATTTVCLENVHPFIIQDTALVHNGIINNADDFTNEISTCDSEAILQQYLNYEVNDKPENISQVTETLEGYYACGVLTKNLDNLMVVDVFKSTSANLFVTQIPEIGGYCFSTDKDDILKAIDLCGWDYKVAIFSALPKVYTRFNAITGELLFQTLFEEKKIVFVPTVVSRKHHRGHTTVTKKESISTQQDNPLDIELGILDEIYQGLSEIIQNEIDMIQDFNAWSNAIWLRRYSSRNFVA